MLIIGELINTSRKKIAPAVANRDAGYIKELARSQVEAGADMVDVNSGTMMKNEPEVLAWLVETIQAEVDAPLCLDSPNPEALERALSVHKGTAMLNSISGEKKRFKEILPLVKKYRTKVVALAMDDNGIPKTAENRLKVASNLVESLTAAGVPAEDIYLDPLVQPISTDSTAGAVVLETLWLIKSKLSGVHTICGLSNVSFGLPQRKLLNQAFIAMTMAVGLDSAIVDPLDERLMSLVTAANALRGDDLYCANYLEAYRKGRLTVA